MPLNLHSSFTISCSHVSQLELVFLLLYSWKQLFRNNFFEFHLFFYASLKVTPKDRKGTSMFAQSIMAAAKQARDEQSLMRILAEDYIIRSMQPDGDCGYELMCKWKEVQDLRKSGRGIPYNVISEAISKKEVMAMRHAIADEQERHIFQKGNATLRMLINQSMFDWWHSPSENNGRNGEVAAAIQARANGVSEREWLDSADALALHSTLVRTGRNEVFAESPEMEAFSLMIGAPLAIYLPGHCELYPQSTYCKSDSEYLVGICNGNHYFLAVPRVWIMDQQGCQRGIFLFFIYFFFQIFSMALVK